MEKLSRIREAMKQNGYEAILLTDEINQYYATGFSFTDGCVLITDKTAHLITDFRYTEDARLHADAGFEIVMPDARAAYITDILTGEGVKTLGYEDISLSCNDFDEMKKLYEFELLPIRDMMQKLREIKDEDELALIAAAQDLTDRALSHLMGMITPTMTEIDVALELEFFMRKNGAEGVAFDTIAVSGNASSLPHGHAANRVLQRGFLTMDFGARFRGYCSDMTRTVCVGSADAEMKRVYETVLTAQKTALEKIRAGVLCREVDAAARELIYGAGYEGAFGHGLGHGVGMFIHESPRLNPRTGDTRLECGHVVTVEPGIYLDGKYGCRIEDMVVVTKDGYKNFTKSPKELIELFV